eukprot:TRINITY_DN3257_c0_g1_i1.p1 TRINITY_DN3257_c0_g1~~TRINITY_DN3257_c0_g1_i1.p1  ORF type:complete len:399 (-),score=124.82 TRINITY_DN3257_c0_g1_i1:192-1283(-)
MLRSLVGSEMCIRDRLYGDQAKYFEDEIFPDTKHTTKGLLAMANAGPNLNTSQFYLTLGEGLDYLDGKHTIFGEISEGLDVLEKLNDVHVDDTNCPIQDVRIHHTHILDDPFDDPPSLEVPPSSPARIVEPHAIGYIGELESWNPEDDKRSAEEIERDTRQRETRSRKEVLTMVGDLMYEEQAPPEHVLFVCCLNPVTTSEDLELIFSQFGKVNRADVIQDWKTSDSLQYAFIEFGSKEVATRAYLKMDNVLIDDRRIHVDFCQSTSKQFGMWQKGHKVATQEDGREMGGNKEKFKLKDAVKPVRGAKHYEMVVDAKRKKDKTRDGDREKRRDRRDKDERRDRRREDDRRQRRSRSPAGGYRR